MKMLLLVIFFLSCNIDKPATPIAPSAESEAIILCIGCKYKICGLREIDPFRNRTVAHVIITDIKIGFVQYCWESDKDKRNTVRFSRSEKEFIDLINNCNNGSANR